MSALRLGLTGGLAAGKSTVAAWLREAGFEVVDADRLVAALYRPGREGAGVVARLFGPEFLDHEGAVDHAQLAARVFSDAAALHLLESEIHPLVRREFETIAQRTPGVVVLEAPLLVEAGFAPEMDLVVTVEADPETRLARAAARGLDPNEARRRVESQTSEAVRIAAAHRVLRNDGTPAELRRQVTELIDEIGEMGERER
jgi:dephospho-CoA kinase